MRRSGAGASAKGSLAEFARLMEQLPTGSGPATTARREAIWARVNADRIRHGQAPLEAMDQGLRYVQELEHTLPAGSKPLVMHAFQAATDIAAEFTHFATTERVENGEMFRLTLIAMRQYLELYAVVCGGGGVTHGGAPRVRPVAVTVAEFEQAVPLLRQWGVRIADPRVTFQRLDKLGGGVIRFDEVARWVMRSQMEALSSAVLFQSSPAKGRAKLAAGTAGGQSPHAPPQRASSAVALTRPPGASTHPVPSTANGSMRLTTHALTLGPTDRKAVRLAIARQGGARGGHLGGGGSGGGGVGYTASTHPGTTIPTRPKARKWDLAERLSEVGLTQYARPLKEMGFDDVRQLLALQHACDERDSKRLDAHNASFASLLDSLHLAPGHRVRLTQFFQNEARNAARVAHEKLLELANAAPDEDEADGRASERALARERELQQLRQRVAELEARQAPGQGGWAYSDAVEGAAVERSKHDFATARPAVARAARAWFEGPRHVGGVMYAPWERTLRPCFDAWRSQTGGRRRQEAFLRRLIHQDIARAFTQWVAVWEGVAKLRRIVQRWVNRPLGRAFNRWAQRSEGLAASSEALASARRFVLSLLNARLKVGFETWKQQHTALKEALSAMRRATNRIVNAAVAYAFDTWKATAGSRREKRAAMIKVLQYFAGGGIAKAWATWVAQLDGFRKLRRAARAITLQPVRRAWNAWVERTEGSAGEKRQLQLARQAILRLQQQGLSRSWQAWLELVDERNRRLATMRAVYARFLMQGAVRCLNKWREVADRRSERDRRMRRFAARLLNLGVARAWGSWVERTAEHKQLQRVLVRYSNQLLVKCWLGWYRYHRMQKVGRVRKLGIRLWNAEDRVAKVLWGIEGAIERRLRGRSKGAKKKQKPGDEDEDEDEEEDEYEYFADDVGSTTRRPVDPTQPLLPAMDGPFVARPGRLETSLAAKSAVLEYQQQQSVRAYEARQLSQQPQQGGYMRVEPPTTRARPYGGSAESGAHPYDADLRPRGFYADTGAGVGVASFKRSASRPVMREGWSGDPADSAQDARRARTTRR